MFNLDNNTNQEILLNNSDKLYEPFNNKYFNSKKNINYSSVRSNIFEKHIYNKDLDRNIKNNNLINLSNQESSIYENLTDSDSNIIDNPNLAKNNTSEINTSNHSSDSNSEDVTNKSNCSSFIGKIPSHFYIPRTYSNDFHEGYLKGVPIIRNITDDKSDRKCNCVIL